jgi:hypothetical protein
MYIDARQLVSVFRQRLREFRNSGFPESRQFVNPTLLFGCAIDDDLYPAIVRPAFSAGIVCNRSVFSDPLRLDQITGVAARDDVRAHYICTLLRQHLIVAG